MYCCRSLPISLGFTRRPSEASDTQSREDPVPRNPGFGVEGLGFISRALGLGFRV